MADRNQDTILFLSQMLAQGKISREQYENSVRAITEMVEPLPGIQDTVARSQQAGRQPGKTGMLAMPASSAPQGLGSPLSTSPAPQRPEFEREITVPRTPKDEYVPPAFAEGGETQLSRSEQELLGTLTTEEARRFLLNRRRELEEADSKVQFDTTGVTTRGDVQTNAPPAPFVPSQRMIDYEVALEEEKARKKTEAARAELAASSPVPEPVGPPPQEVIDFARRNYKQKYDNADEGMKRLIESRIREQMEPVAMGAGASDMVLFERWKNTGSWGVPYDQVPADVIRAAQRYTVNFGPPKKSSSPKEREVAPYTTLETGASFPGFAYGETLRTGIDAYLARPESGDEVAGVGRGAPMYQKGYVEPEDRELSQRRIERGGQNDAARRRAVIRAISRRPYERRQSQLDRANTNLPNYLKINPEEVGLPRSGEQRVNQVRQVSSITDVSAKNAMAGEYLESPQGMFRVGNNNEKIPMRRTPDGFLVPDADKMSPSDFANQVNKEESRRIFDLIISSGDRDLARRATGIRRARAQIRSDQYDDSTQESQLSRLKEMQDELQYEFLTEFLPGATEVVAIEPFPDLVPSDVEEGLVNERRQVDLEFAKRRQSQSAASSALNDAMKVALSRMDNAEAEAKSSGSVIGGGTEEEVDAARAASVRFALEGINYNKLAEYLMRTARLNGINLEDDAGMNDLKMQLWRMVAAELKFTEDETRSLDLFREFGANLDPKIGVPGQ